MDGDGGAGGGGIQGLPGRAAAALGELVEVRDSGIHGRGVFARRPIEPGRRIGRYAGRRVANGSDPGGWRDDVTYFFGLSDGSLIDGARGGNATRFLNHACEPNVEAVEQHGRAGRLEIVFHALRRIEPGEELLLDYRLHVEGDPQDYPCRCRAAGCRGTLAAAARE